MSRGGLLLVGIAACLVGCGSSRNEPNSTPSATFKTYINALASSDGTTACGVLTVYARTRATEDSTTGCKQLVHELRASLGTQLDRLRQARLKITSEDGHSSEGTARLGTRTAFAVFAKAHGEWRLDSPNIARLLLGLDRSAHL